MEQRTYYGPITARALAETLVDGFNKGHLLARAGNPNPGQFVVQIETREMDRGGRKRSALTIYILQKDDSVEVEFDEHQWLGAAGDLLEAGLRAARNPFALLGRLDDITDDVETLQLPEQVWKIIEHAVSTAEEPPPDFVTCPYCNTANEIGVLKCPACGGNLADSQPRTQ